MFRPNRIFRCRICLTEFFVQGGPARAGVAIGDLVLDLAVLEEAGFFRH